LLIAAALAAFIVAPATAQAARCAYADSQPRLVGHAKATQAMVCLVNDVRAREGLPALTVDPRLSTAARSYARRMAREDFFSHASPGGQRLTGRLRSAGWVHGNARWSAAETIGWGMSRSASPRRVLRVWLANPRDRAVLLSRKTRIGVGVATGLPFRSRCRGATYTLVTGRR
jgi:uncharacterized protein YkwD